jgi:hypothetical protein
MRGSTTRPRGQRGRAAASQVGPAAADDGFVLDCAQLGTLAAADAAPGRQLLLARTREKAVGGSAGSPEPPGPLAYGLTSSVRSDAFLPQEL